MKKLLAVVLATMSFFSLAMAPKDFATNNTTHGVKISPDGTNLGILKSIQGKRVVLIVDAKTYERKHVVIFGGKEEVLDFYWASDDRIVASIGERKGTHEALLNYGELYGVNADGSKGKVLFGYRAGGGNDQTGSRVKKQKNLQAWGFMIDPLPEDEDFVMINAVPMQGELSTVYKMNIHSGKVSRVKNAPYENTSFFTNTAGELAFAVSEDEEGRDFVFMLDENKEWQEQKWISKDVRTFKVQGGSPNGESIYVLTDAGNDITGLYKYNLKEKTHKKIFADKDVDITNAVKSYDKRRVYALRIDPGFPTYLTFSKSSDEAKVFKNILASFPGHQIAITSGTRDSKFWTVRVSSDTSPGMYYLFDKEANKISGLFKVKEGLDAKAMSYVEPINFKSRDGAVLHGYLTGIDLQAKKPAAKPMVVLVHGGPFGVRDYWEYDSEVQMLANEGYAVLQVNFRGSDGYGINYETSAYKGWGSMIQNDIVDGVNWAINKGYVDDGRVCIMGGSFGGYSAVMSAIQQPDLFKCAVANAGVYDLDLLSDKGENEGYSWIRTYFRTTVGMKPELLKKYSPVNHVEKLKAPVFIAHGKQDSVAVFEHATSLRDELDKHDKEYEWFVKGTESHGFFNEDNRAEYFEKVAAFIKKHI